MPNPQDALAWPEAFVIVAILVFVIFLIRSF